MRLAFMGLMRSGKDTSLDYVKGKIGGKSLRFADPIYDIQKAVYQIVGLPEKKDRTLLQLIGTQWGRRTIDENIWVNVVVDRIKKEDPKTNLFLADARFSNEERALRELGFKFIMLKAPEATLVERGASNLTHESEWFAANYTGADYTILNNGTLEDLHTELDKVLALIQPDEASSLTSHASLPKRAGNQLIC
jgi:hypothetical protein